MFRPVAFEKDTTDAFGVEGFLEGVAGAREKKRGLDTGKDREEARKRARD